MKGRGKRKEKQRKSMGCGFRILQVIKDKGHRPAQPKARVSVQSQAHARPHVDGPRSSWTCRTGSSLHPASHRGARMRSWAPARTRAWWAGPREGLGILPSSWGSASLNATGRTEAGTGPGLSRRHACMHACMHLPSWYVPWKPRV